MCVGAYVVALRRFNKKVITATTECGWPFYNNHNFVSGIRALAQADQHRAVNHFGRIRLWLNGAYLLSATAGVNNGRYVASSLSGKDLPEDHFCFIRV